MEIVAALAEEQLLTDELNADPMEEPPQDLLDRAIALVEQTLKDGGV